MPASSPVDRRVIGVDLGGTKTRLAVALDGVIEADVTVPTGHWRTGDLTQDAASLAKMALERWDLAQRVPWGVGAHGCDSNEQCQTMETELARYVSGPIAVRNDAELMPLAMGVVDGIGLVAGTGSIAVARDAQGRLIAAGGWGWVLGDEGSAAGIVREAVRAVLRELDFGRAADLLTATMLDAFQVPDGPELAMAVSRWSSADVWGGYARHVFEAADRGSTIAADVIDDAGRQLSSLIPRLRARGVTSRELVAGGGVLVSQPRLRAAFVAGLATDSPDVDVRFLSTAPVVGALALAASLIARPPRPDSTTPEVTP